MYEGGDGVIDGGGCDDDCRDEVGIGMGLATEDCVEVAIRVCLA